MVSRSQISGTGRKKLRGLQCPLEIMSLEIMTKSVGVGTYLQSWRERVSDFRSCNAEAVGDKKLKSQLLLLLLLKAKFHYARNGAEIWPII